MILSLISFPILGIILNNSKLFYSFRRECGLFFSIFTMYISLYIYLLYNNNNIEFQLREDIRLLGDNFIFTIGLDGLSLSIILIISILTPIIIYLREGKTQEKERIKINIILFMEILLLTVFVSLDIFIFFILFELILIPMFILIGMFGSRINRLEASYRFILYTMLGSFFMLLSIIILFIKYGTTNNELLNMKIIDDIFNNNIFIIKMLWVFIFFSFMIKIPIFPFHSWLPEAHTEAPTIGSIILAGILLKLGSFGIYRYNIYLFNSSFLFKFNKIFNLISYFIPIILILTLLSLFYCSILSIRSPDLKKIIAYSSIVHINFSIFSFFSNDFIGLIGCSYLFSSHAYISSGLFLLIGILYKRYHTRNFIYFRSLSLFMPIFSFFFFIFILANISLPITSAFISEFLLLLSSFKYNFFLGILLCFSLFFSSIYSLWFTIRILFSSSSCSSLNFYLDLSFNEFLSILPFFFLTIYLGLNTKPLIILFTLPIINILN